MTDKSDSIGKIAYEAAADTTRCFQSWSEANQPKWEAAAEAVQKHFIKQVIGVIHRTTFKHGHITDSGMKMLPEDRLIKAILGRFEGEK